MSNYWTWKNPSRGETRSCFLKDSYQSCWIYQSPPCPFTAPIRLWGARDRSTLSPSAPVTSRWSSQRPSSMGKYNTRGSMSELFLISYQFSARPGERLTRCARSWSRGICASRWALQMSYPSLSMAQGKLWKTRTRLKLSYVKLLDWYVSHKLSNLSLLVWDINPPGIYCRDRSCSVHLIWFWTIRLMFHLFRVNSFCFVFFPFSCAPTDHACIHWAQMPF